MQKYFFEKYIDKRYLVFFAMDFMKTERVVNLDELFEFQSRQNLEHVCEKVKVLRSELVDEMLSYGMTEKTANKIFRGEEVIVCGDCGTANMSLEFSYPAKLYRCSNCNTTYVP